MMRKDKDFLIETKISESVVIKADKTYFANIINNLIDNAIKYSGNNVNISIEGNEEKITVSDNGIGIPEKSLPYIFDKFYRVPHGNRQDVRGYGIGLYYVKILVKKMGWEISVRSKINIGSVFTIYFKGDE